MIRVYISSTYRDLVKERQAAAEAVRLLGCHPVAMEDYVARDERPAEASVADVRQSDIYVGILAWRYGYRPPGQVKSITRMEYEAARAAGLPCFLFLHAEEQKGDWPAKWVDEGTDAEEVLAFRREVSERHTPSFFENPDRLQVRVNSALSQHLRTVPMGKPQVPALLPYLADRSRQCDQLADALDEQARTRPRRPLVVIVHGDEREAHAAFLDRLREHTLPRLMKLARDTDPVHRLELRWSDPEGTLDERRRRLRQRLAEAVKGDPRAPFEQVAQELVQHRCPVMITASLSSEEWEAQEPELVGEWLSWWEGWPDQPADQPLLPVLSIQYKNTADLSWLRGRGLRRRNEAAAAFVEQLDFTRYAGLTGARLDRLKSVEERHVMEWIENEAAAFCRQARGALREPLILAERLKPRVQDLFRLSKDRTDEGIPMERLAVALRTELERCLVAAD